MASRQKVIFLRRLAYILSLVAIAVFFQNCGQGFSTSLGDSSTDASSESGQSTPPPPLTCELAFHVENGACVSNTKMCPITNGRGEEVWTGTTYAPCRVIDCIPNYRNQNNTCVFSPSSCPIANGNGQTNADGTCRLLTCNPGYHTMGNACAIDVRPCPITNGTGTEAWNGTAYGACQIAQCNPNFHRENNSCVSNTQPCPVANGVGTYTWNGTAYGACMVSSCSPGFTNTGTACTPTVVINPGFAPRNSARIFISGHSLTDYPLPTYVFDIANKRGDSVAYNHQFIPGSPIRSRTRGDGNTGWAGYSMGTNKDGRSNMNVLAEFANPQTIGAGQRYDTLVIAENHHSVAAIQWENTIGYLRNYHDRIVAANPAARTFFYNTWIDVNKSAPAPWIDHEKKATVAWECVASKVNLTLEAAGRSDRVRNLPTSAALVDLVEKALANQVTGISGTTLEKMNMIFDDTVHLTSLGVYYMSLVTYSAVYAKAPSGITPPAGSGISSSQATQLQSMAWNFASNYYTQANPGVRDMDYCRTYVPQQVCVSMWTVKAETGQIPACQNYFTGNSTPFRWPDPNFVLLQ